jgi:hypothetical protein
MVFSGMGNRKIIPSIKNATMKIPLALLLEKGGDKS